MMNTYELIKKKRNGDSLTTEEIGYLIEGFTTGRIPDYQMAAFLMSVYFKGMNARECRDLTMKMVHSGDSVDLSPIKGFKVDKHSTGGVGTRQPSCWHLWWRPVAVLWPKCPAGNWVIPAARSINSNRFPECALILVEISLSILPTGFT